LTLRARLYDARGADREVDLSAEVAPRVDDERLLWIDLDDRTASDLQIAAAAIGLEREALRVLANPDHPSRFLRLPDRVVLSLGAVDPDDEDAMRRPLDIVVGPNHIVTVHDGPLDAIDSYRREIRNEAELGRLDAAALTAGLLDTVFAGFLSQVESIERDIDSLDQLAVRLPSDERFLADVLTLRRRIARLRRALVPNREALWPLTRPDFELRGDLGRVSPDIVARLERSIDSVENARELLVGTFDLYLGRASQRTNDVMKALTLISAIALPAIVLAGVMGMNFKLAFFDNPENFWIVAATMIAFALLIVFVGRRQHWI
jgi:magnesium/cobalt transport protein CorA